ncbi:hypothetical protein E4U41_005223 [Claviceps citrina]|nr:hypothetical protein E4U41_005223 [Claviceps citrina]
MATGFQFPRMYLLSTHLNVEEYSHLRNSVPSFIDDINGADIAVGKITTKKRAEFELRRQSLDVRPLHQGCGEDDTARGEGNQENESIAKSQRRKAGGNQSPDASNDVHGLIQVVKLSWLTDSLAQQKLLPIDDYLLLQGIKEAKEGLSQHESTDRGQSKFKIIQRAGEDKDIISSRNPSYLAAQSSASEGVSVANVPSLRQQTTREHEDAMVFLGIPDFLRTPYSCQRPTPMDPPNSDFIQELKRIRTFRLLQGDNISVRAYSTAIATLSAYPSTIRNPAEIELLPGCSTKIVEIYQQWAKHGHSTETLLAASDTKLSTLQLFYDIWGVGDATARDFYRKGMAFRWRDLDDVAEHGWQSLSRVQQIGVKYYDEFKKKISRQEVEDIAKEILAHARRIDPGFEMAIVGGYRRGKKESGDVDVVLSHREEAQTLYMIEKLVLSLESAGLITHTLSLWANNSERGQLPLAWRGHVSGRGSGFDTLDKALVVWQNNQHSGAGALHRRVDIIISPWKTVGCALLGWSGGTTFERDLRRYCKQEKGLKFDSSGIRRRSDGSWIDFEGSRAAREHMPVKGDDHSAAPDMGIAEKRVFDGLGLQWRPPTERCTG